MKKTMIALVALSGLALAATTDEVTKDLTLPTSGLLEHKAWFYGHEDVAKVFDKVKGEELGAYAGNNGGSGGSWTNTAGTEGYWDGSTGTITLAGRNGTQGESFALVLNNTINIGDKVSAVTFSGTIDADSNIDAKNLSFSVAIYDGGTAIGTADTVTVVGSSSEAKDFTVTLSMPKAYAWTSTSKIIAAIAGPAFTPAGDIYNVSGINVAATIIPEPATATLSLLALAGLAARRRRH